MLLIGKQGSRELSGFEQGGDAVNQRRGHMHFCKAASQMGRVADESGGL